MILTYKVKHNKDYSVELTKARKVAEFTLKQRTFSSKDVKHLGLKSMIANQILRKYGRNKKIMRIRRVNLIIPNQGIKVDKTAKVIRIPCLKLTFDYCFPNNFEKINQIEVNNQNIFVSVTVLESIPIDNDNKWIGVDLNTTGHCAVVGIPSNGKVHKLGKKALHIRKKYMQIRRMLQKRGVNRQLGRVKRRESRIIKDLDHKVSRKIIEIAKECNAGIVLEDLKNIRKTTKARKSFKYSLNSWSFYQLKTFIDYKAKLLGIPVTYIDPRNTSKTCSRCGRIGSRTDKKFECLYLVDCGHVDHADVNASFNIAQRMHASVNLVQTEMSQRGSLITPDSNAVNESATIEPTLL
ncbi:MAG: RNA-guided endonuclease InsQ/TnpB family protein [Candidatus Hodarchaeales archaeon]|jgi:putative transposase